MQNLATLLNEIFMVPARQGLENRFTSENAAGCNGSCIGEGGCKVFVEDEIE